MRGGERAGDGGVTELEETDEFGAHLFERGGLGIVVRENVVGEIEGGLAELPVAEAGFFPGVEILLFDEFAVESFGADVLGFREGVDPCEDGFGRLGVIEAAV